MEDERKIANQLISKLKSILKADRDTAGQDADERSFEKMESQLEEIKKMFS